MINRINGNMQTIVGTKLEIEDYFRECMLNSCNEIMELENEHMIETRCENIKKYSRYINRLTGYNKYSMIKMDDEDIIKVDIRINVENDSYMAIYNISKHDACETEYMMYLAIEIKECLLKDKMLYLDNYHTALIDIYKSFKAYDDNSCGLLEMVDSFIDDKKDFILNVLKHNHVCDNLD